MSVWNEYSKLKTVLLGKRFDEKITKDRFKEKDIVNAMIKINNETNDDLDRIHEYLEKNNVTVHRPKIDRYWELKDEFNTTDICDPGAIRDWCFAYGDTIFTTNLSFPERRFEHYFWEDTFLELQKTKNIISNRYCFIGKDYTIKFNNRDDYSDQIQQIKDNLIAENNDMFMGIITHCDYYLSGTNVDDAFFNYYLNDFYKNKNFLHSASYFKHGNIIFGSPQGTKLGISSFEHTIKSIYPSTQFVYVNDMIHIDGYQTIIDENTIIRNAKYYDTIEINKDSMYSDMNVINIPGTNLNKLDIFEYDEITNAREINFKKYLNNLQGYDQRVDFDLNALTISPRKIISGIFDDKKLNIVNEMGIETVNIPIRHRWILDGGIHCYTLDIDRE